MPRKPLKYSLPSRFQAEIPNPAMPAPGKLGPCFHSPVAGSNRSTRSEILPFSSIPPTTTSFPFQVPATSARRLTDSSFTSCHPAWGLVKSYTNVAGCHVPGDFPTSSQPPTTYSLSPTTAALCDDRGAGSGG